MSEMIIASFYKFVDLPDFAERREPLLVFCQEHQLHGSILLAPEGINGALSGEKTAVRHVLNSLRNNDPAWAGLEHKEAIISAHPFGKIKVRLKKEIVRLKMPNINPNNQVGTYVPPSDWNNLINRPDIKLIDTRNAFEVGMGSFKGALNPETLSFSEFPDYVSRHLDPAKDKNVALFCTGGIRCEKATSYLLEQGFENVFHLQGGILKYLEQIEPEESLWGGECFVFDERVSVVHGQKQGSYSIAEQLKFELEWKQALFDKRAAEEEE